MSFYWTLGSIPGLGTLEPARRRQALKLAVAQIPVLKRVAVMALSGAAAAVLVVLWLGRGPASWAELAFVALAGAAAIAVGQQCLIRWALPHVPGAVARVRGVRTEGNA